jgi:ABC-type antimicrobial peptide transport system permease subunit
MAAIPGVRSVSGVRNGILQNGNTSRIIFVPGHTQAPGGDVVESADIGPQFFETTGLPLIAGRDFQSSDSINAPKVVIISESLARRYFPGVPSVGKLIGVGSQAPQFEVIGVAREARLVAIRHEAGPMLYVPVLQTATRRLNAIELRTIGDPRSVIASARQQILALNRRLLVDVETVPQEIEGTLIEERMVSDLSAVFGLLALLLTSGGLYGLLSYSVTRRAKEIGIRTALGAQRGRIIAMVLRETLALVAIGLAIGIPLTLAAVRFAGPRIAGLLFGVKPTDPIAIVATVLPLVISAMIAGFFPALRAASVDQIAALRHE